MARKMMLRPEEDRGSLKRCLITLDLKVYGRLVGGGEEKVRMVLHTLEAKMCAWR